MMRQTVSAQEISEYFGTRVLFEHLASFLVGDPVPPLPEQWEMDWQMVFDRCAGTQFQYWTLARILKKLG